MIYVYKRILVLRMLIRKENGIKLKDQFRSYNFQSGQKS